MDRQHATTVPAPAQAQSREASQPLHDVVPSAPASAPQVLDERLLAQVVGGIPRVGGW